MNPVSGFQVLGATQEGNPSTASPAGTSGLRASAAPQSGVLSTGNRSGLRVSPSPQRLGQAGPGPLPAAGGRGALVSAGSPLPSCPCQPCPLGRVSRCTVTGETEVGPSQVSFNKDALHLTKPAFPEQPQSFRHPSRPPLTEEGLGPVLVQGLGSPVLPTLGCPGQVLQPPSPRRRPAAVPLTLCWAYSASSVPQFPNLPEADRALAPGRR